MKDDFFQDITLIDRVQTSTPSGWQYVYVQNKTIKGVCLKKGIAEQTQSALLKNDKIQYQLSTYKDDILDIGQIFKWTTHGKTNYAIVKNYENESPEGSAIEDIQVYDAESYIMRD